MPLLRQRLSTSNKIWHLVIHQVTSSSIQVWVGVLNNAIPKPTEVRLSLKQVGTQPTQVNHIISETDWSLPFEGLACGFYYLHTFDNLPALSCFEILLTQSDTELQHPIQPLCFGHAKTLGNDLQAYGDQGFTIANASCFGGRNNGGNVSNAYRSLYFSLESISPDIKFLTGDQVYLDIGFDSWDWRPDKIRNRIAKDYQTSWQHLSGILSHGGTWLLADDHEYWNNYPSTKLTSPFLLALKSKRVEKVWRSMAISAVQRVQQIPPIRTFKLGNDLDFCIADLRTSRNVELNKLADNATINAVIEWLEQLTSPGILVLPQPIVIKSSSKRDSNLATFKEDYSKLVQTIDKVNHDVLLLSGDVHYGCIKKIPLTNDKHLYEAIASPMCNLTGISSIATDFLNSKKVAKDHRYSTFPPYDIGGVEPKPIKYLNFVSSEYKVWDLKYLFRKTKEHLMTINFKPLTNGAVHVAVNTWLIKETSDNGLPNPDWDKPVQFTLS